MALITRRILDLGGEIAGPTGRLLAALGAQVTLVEPPGGIDWRRRAPFSEFAPRSHASLFFAFHAAGLNAITLNLASRAGQTILHTLLASFDAALDAHPIAFWDRLGVSLDSLQNRKPGQVWCSVTRFGARQSRSRQDADAMITLAASGVMRITGTTDGGPCPAPGALADEAAGVFAAAGILLAFQSKVEGPIWLDISAQECALAGLYPISIAHFDYHGTLDNRAGRALDLFTPCADGRDVLVYPVTAGVWKALVHWLGDPDVLTDPSWLDIRYRRVNADAISAFLEALSRTMDSSAFFEEGQRRGIATSPVSTPRQFLEDRHERARAFSRPMQGAQDASHPFLAEPFRLDGDAVIAYAPAPPVGNANVATFCGQLGISRGELQALKASGAV